jgi:hypothetical protein
MECLRECFQSIHTLIFGDPRNNFRVVMAWVRAEKTKRDSIHNSSLSSLSRSFLTARKEADVYQRAATEFRDRQYRDHFAAASQAGEVIFDHWSDYISSSRSGQVDMAFTTLCELSGFLNVEQLTDWIGKQPRKPFQLEPVETEELNRGDLPGYLAQVIDEIGISAQAQANLRKLGLFAD